MFQDLPCRYVTLNPSTKVLEHFGVHTAKHLNDWASTIETPGQSKTKATSNGWPVQEKVGWQSLLIALCEAETVFRHYKSNLQFVVDLCMAWRQRTASPDLQVPVVEDVNGQSVAVQYICQVAKALCMEPTKPPRRKGSASRAITMRQAAEELIKADLLQKLGWPCTADLAASVALVTTSMKLVNAMLLQLSSCYFSVIF